MKRVLVSRRLVALFATASCFLVASTASAQEPLPPAPDAQPSDAPPPPTVIVANPTPAPAVELRDRPAPEGAPRYDLVRINAGFRFGYVGSRGFDTFASNDVLPQFSIDGTYPLLTQGKLVLAAGLGWDVGARSDAVRGFDATLAAHRLYVPIEGRYHVKPWLFAFGKVSPGAAAMVTSVTDPAANNLSSTAWAFAADVSVGASILMGPRSHYDKRGPRFWITPELGYAYTTTATLGPNPGRDDATLLGSDEDTNLRKLALSGFFWRASVGMTF